LVNTMAKLKLDLLTVDRDHGDGQKVGALDQDEYIELTEVAFTNTVIDPRAVVIVAVHTVIAERAMAASWCPYNGAIWAETAGLHAVE